MFNNKNQKKLGEYKELKIVSESLDKMNLYGKRMDLYHNLRRKLNELKVINGKFNINEYNAKKQRLIDIYKSKIYYIDVQLEKHGINHSLLSSHNKII